MEESEVVFLETDRRGSLFYVQAESLAILLPTILWTIENVPNQLGNVREISNQC